MLSANDLPTELWLAIAAELPSTRESTRCPIPRELIGIHRSFFALYMNHKYGEIHWTKLDKSLMIQLRRLQEPIVAMHVRHLQIHAWFIDYLLKRETDLDIGTLQVHILSRLRSFLSARPSLKPVAEGDDFATSFARKKTVATVSSKTVLKLMISAIRNMQNVEEYHFELRDLTLTKGSEQFLVAARQALGASLRKLSLNTSIFKFKSILHFTDFNHLDELKLYFDYYSAGSSDASQIEATRSRESQELMNTVVPFMNRQKDSLTSLTIASYSHTDLTPFFPAVGPFPSLRRLSANIFMNEPHLSDIDTFIRFLHAHRSSLFYLDLKVRTPEATHISSSIMERRKSSWARVQTALLRYPELLYSLEALHIPGWNVDATAELLTHCCSHSLTHLSLNFHSFDMPELTQVLDIFLNNPFQLRSLLVHVQMLSIECLRLLAKRLPGLHSVVLFFDNCDPAYVVPGPLDQTMLGQVDWDVQHLTVYSCSLTGIGPEDAALLDLPSARDQSSDTYSEITAKKLPNVQSYRAIPWHLQLSNLQQQAS